MKINLACDHNVMNYFECFASLFEEIINRLNQMIIGETSLQVFYPEATCVENDQTLILKSITNFSFDFDNITVKFINIEEFLPDYIP